MNNDHRMVMLLLLILLVILTGCSGEEATLDNAAGDQLAEPTAQAEPVEITVYAPVIRSQKDFDDFLAVPTHRKFPNITLKFSEAKVAKDLDALIAAGDIPDIIFNSLPSLIVDRQSDLPLDLTPLIKRNAVDMKRFNPVFTDAVEAYGNHQMLGLPVVANFSALFYNKDIFDKFAVAYPQDGMTWDQALDLARKLTRFSDGTQYYGMEPGVVQTASGQLSLGFVDPQTHKATLNTDGWKRMFQFLEQVYTIPGNRPKTARVGATIRDDFVKNKTMAMLADWGIDGITFLTSDPGAQSAINWDFVSLPYFKEAPGVGRKVDTHLMRISKGSKHQDAAFQVIDYLTKDETQLMAAQLGRYPVVANPDVIRQFGSKLPALQGKNMNVIYNYKPAGQFPPTIYDNLVQAKLVQAYNSVYAGQKDINSALRDAEEQANQAIAAEMSK